MKKVLRLPKCCHLVKINHLLPFDIFTEYMHSKLNCSRHRCFEYILTRFPTVNVLFNLTKFFEKKELEIQIILEKILRYSLFKRSHIQGLNLTERIIFIFLSLDTQHISFFKKIFHNLLCHDHWQDSKTISRNPVSLIRHTKNQNNVQIFCHQKQTETVFYTIA